MGRLDRDETEPAGAARREPDHQGGSASISERSARRDEGRSGAVRDAEGNWPPTLAPEQLRTQVHDNLDHLGLEVLNLVYLRVGGSTAPSRARSPNRSPRWRSCSRKD